MEQVEELQAERQLLVAAKTEVDKSLAELGISNSRAKYARGTIANQEWRKRTALAKKAVDLQKRITEINSILKPMMLSNNQQMDAVKEIIIESFGKHFLKEFIQAIVKRAEGEKVGLLFPSQQREVKTFRKEVNELYDMTVSARKAINLYIQQNEPEINKADFFKKISALTKSLPPLTEIQKMKVKSNF